jgi:HK97 family phage major capsid protein
MKNKFTTFALFLQSKSISKENFDKKTEDEQISLLKEHAESQEAYIKELVEAGKTSDEEIQALKKDLSDTLTKENKALVEAVAKQGKAITKLLNSANGLTIETVEQQVSKFLEENAEKLREIKNSGHGYLELNLKAVAPLTSESAQSVAPLSNLMGVTLAPPSNVPYRTMGIMNLVNMFNTSQALYSYTESVPLNDGTAFVAEGGTKPQSDFKIETRYAEPVKVASYEVLTEEAIQDIPLMQSIATDFLRKTHDLKKERGILFGTGVSPEPKGATVYAGTFTAGSMALKVKTPNFMDVVNACITDIYTRATFTDQIPYQANLVLVNPVDFYLQLVSAKDNDGLPLYPQAGLFNAVSIGGVTIRPELSIPVGKIFVADMSKYNVTNYVGYSVRIGWINDQMIKNQFTMVGESRFHAFVKKLDEKAFLYDDIATVKSAITLP